MGLQEQVELSKSGWLRLDLVNTACGTGSDRITLSAGANGVGQECRSRWEWAGVSVGLEGIG